MRKSRYTEAQIVSILKELVEGRVSGAPTRARDYDAPQSSSSQHVQVPILARSGAPNCCCRTSCLPPVDLALSFRSRNARAYHTCQRPGFGSTFRRSETNTCYVLATGPTLHSPCIAKWKTRSGDPSAPPLRRTLVTRL
jgi:hypothetical protein